MRIHTDNLTAEDLRQAVPRGCYLEYTTHGSRKRDHAFQVGLSAAEGTDAHGIKRCYARNTGQYGGDGYGDRAATWVEWGDWMVALLKIDPDAIIGQYEGADDFVAQTTQYAPSRPAREDAQAHAERWAKELRDVAIERKLKARADKIAPGMGDKITFISL